jgi:stage III sporulation protein AE
VSAPPESLGLTIGNHLSRFDLTGISARGLPSFAELVQQAVSGQLDISLTGIIDAGTRLFLNELLTNNRLVGQLLIVAVLSGLLKCLSDSFKFKSASELGFYVSYILMILLAASSFHVVAGILTETVTGLSGMMEASVPVVISLIAMSGNIAGAAAFHPLLLIATQLVLKFITDIFIPLVLASAALTAVNHITEEKPLTQMTLLIKKIADWMLKGIVALYMLLLTLQKISVPIVNNFAVHTARTAAEAVPVIGGALNSAMETVLNFSGAAKSGVLVALVVFLCVAAAVPLLKMLAVMFVYKVVAALTQPFCDLRFTLCLNQIGGYMGVLANAGALAAVMFISSVVILLSGGII